MDWIGLDSETNGLDVYHSARPYLVTICDEQYTNTCWEWDVNPITRAPKIHKKDVEEIAHAILQADNIVIQNAKFDVGVLTPILPPDFKWPFERIHDTTYAAHLLASNKPKDLTSLAMDYLEIDITRFENDVEEATNKCRNLIRRKNSPIADWRKAEKGLPEMPSAKEKCWKFDMWMPRAVATWATTGTLTECRKNQEWVFGRGATSVEFEPWFDLTSIYANTDSATCLAVFLRQKKLIEERGLWDIYEFRRKLVRCVVKMETNGVTLDWKRHQDAYKKFKELNDTAAASCLNIAKSYDYELELPKGGKNNSLSTFVFDVLKLPPVQIGNQKKKKTDAPSLDKNCVAHYAATLPTRSKPLKFITSLSAKRSTSTALQYLDSYQRFWLPTDEPSTYLLHPSLNGTGTDTLRWSSNNPNEQNISKREELNLRPVFGPAPGREWWSLDAQNIELRIPAYEAGEQDMIDLFEKPTEPPYYGSNHLLNFHTVYPDIWERGVKKVGLSEVGRWCKKEEKEWHQRCKNGGFAVQYGAIDRADGSGTADVTFGRPGSHAKLKQRFQKIHGPTGLNQQMIAFANEHGYVETIPDKDVDPHHGYPLLCTRSVWGRILPTVPLNYHVQGTACWWMCKAMLRVQEQLDEWNRAAGFEKYKMVMQVHDELVLDFPAGTGTEPHKTNLPKIKQVIRLMKMGGDDIGIPTAVNCEYHAQNWSDGIPIYFNKAS